MTTELKESEKLELKKSTSKLKEAVISIAAILNKHLGGDLYFGISNDGTVIGQTVAGKTIRDVTKSISDHIESRIFYPNTEKKPIHRDLSSGTKQVEFNCVNIGGAKL